MATNRDGGKGEIGRGKKDEGTLTDGRTVPIFIHSIIDDMTGLSPNTMRVYMHLARRAQKSGAAWPSYQSIGDHCFATVYKHPDGRRKHAVAAIAELIKAKLIRKEMRVNEHGQQSNVYILLDPVTLQSQPGVTLQSLPCDATVTPAVTLESLPPVTVASPKDTPLEDTPIEDSPVEESSSSASSSEPEKDDDDDLAFKSIVTAWDEGMPDKATKHIRDKLKELVAECDPDAVIHGIMATVEAGGRSFKYVATCTRNHVAAAQRRDGVSGLEPARKTGYSDYATDAPSPDEDRLAWRAEMTRAKLAKGEDAP